MPLLEQCEIDTVSDWWEDEDDYLDVDGPEVDEDGDDDEFDDDED